MQLPLLAMPFLTGTLSSREKARQPKRAILLGLLSGLLSDENTLIRRQGLEPSQSLPTSHRSNSNLELAKQRMPHLQQFSTGAHHHTIFVCLDYVLISLCSSVPTHDQILVPETLLKKRKSQEKARAERTAEIDAKKKVSRGKIHTTPQRRCDVQPFATRHCRCCCKYIIFRV